MQPGNEPSFRESVDIMFNRAVALMDLPPGLEEKIRVAFRLATSREISDGELHELTGLAKDLQEKHGVSDDQLMSRICLLILNLNETLYLD